MSIVDTAMTSRKRKREEYKKIILLDAACVVHMVIGVVTWYHNNYFFKEPTRNWELERQSFLNRLYRGTNKDCIEQLRLSKNAFFNLCRILQEKGGLVRTRNVPTTEAVAMFLHILAHNLKYRVVQFSYCRSKETISRQFNDILRAVMKVSKDYLNFQPCTLEGAEANKWRWFERCIGALDETHIPITVSPDERPRYRNRKGDVSTNVLAACGPDLRVCRRFLSMYFLVDAGYTNGPGFLAPYRGTRYHLNEWIGNTPQSYKELFNLCHASAQNAIERSFGILKKRWSILRTPSFFDIKTQIRIINACFVEEVQNNVIDDITTIQATEEWTRFRDTLAMNIDQRNLGNKGDGGWKRSALNAAAAVLSTSFNIMSKIVSNYGDRGWDGTKHMITVENENAWNEYCTSHKSAKPFRLKIEPPVMEDADEAMSRQTNEVEFMGLGATAIDLEESSSNTKGKRQGSTSSGTHPHKRKMGEKKGIGSFFG
ncbi:hypothetical protein HKD37_12G034225 [Glycine soja]